MGPKALLGPIPEHPAPASRSGLCIEFDGERYPAKASLKAFTIKAMPESECECPISSELQHSEAPFGSEHALPVLLQALDFLGKFQAVPEESEHI